MQNEEKALRLTRLLRESIDNQFEGFQLHRNTEAFGGSIASIFWATA